MLNNCSIRRCWSRQNPPKAGPAWVGEDHAAGGNLGFQRHLHRHHHPQEHHHHGPGYTIITIFNLSWRWFVAPIVIFMIITKSSEWKERLVAPAVHGVLTLLHSPDSGIIIMTIVMITMFMMVFIIKMFMKKNGMMPWFWRWQNIPVWIKNCHCR